jgi:ATP-dependent DNA helicase RecG
VVEEALANAVYHKSYELGKPIEVQIWPDKIEILSYPGPVPPVDSQILRQNKRIVARDYRNRRIGDFLKELKLTEGRGTGFPIMYRKMNENGSPEPVFQTDEPSSYFLSVLQARIGSIDRGLKELSFVKLKLHFKDVEELSQYLRQLSDRESDQGGVQGNVEGDDQKADRGQMQVTEENMVEVSVQGSVQGSVHDVSKGNIVQTGENPKEGVVKRDVEGIYIKELLDDQVHDKILYILEFVWEPRKRSEIFQALGMTSHIKNKQKYIDPLLREGWVALTIPEKPTHQDQ